MCHLCLLPRSDSTGLTNTFFAPWQLTVKKAINTTSTFIRLDNFKTFTMPTGNWRSVFYKTNVLFFMKIDVQK